MEKHEKRASFPLPCHKVVTHRGCLFDNPSRLRIKKKIRQREKKNSESERKKKIKGINVDVFIY